MNSVHLTASRFFGGPERQMLGLAEALRPEQRTSFVSFSEGGLCQAFLDKARHRGFDGVALQHDTPHLLAALRELTGVLRRLDAHVLLCHGYKANLIGLLAARRLRIPAVSVCRGWTGECRRVRVYEALDRRVLRWMDRVVCVSRAQAEKVRRAGVRDERITVIHNAIDPGRFASPRPEYRDRLSSLFPAPPAKIVGAAGRLSPEKGFDVLIDAAALVAGASTASPLSRLGRGAGGEGTQADRNGVAPISRNARGAGGERACAVGFVLFGDGPLRPALAERIAARGLAGRFVLAGFRDDLDNCLPHLDLFVLPSFTEGLPNVALEACAAGVPVVATAVGGTPEVIEDGKTGYLVAPGDAAALAARIGDLLSDASQTRRMTARGRARVEESFSFAAQAEAYRAVFQTLMAMGCRASRVPAVEAGLPS